MGVDIFCPPLKGEEDQPNGWWKGPIPDVRPPTRKRVLSPFQGDTGLTACNTPYTSGSFSAFGRFNNFLATGAAW